MKFIKVLALALALVLGAAVGVPESRAAPVASASVLRAAGFESSHIVQANLLGKINGVTRSIGGAFGDVVGGVSGGLISAGVPGGVLRVGTSVLGGSVRRVIRGDSVGDVLGDSALRTGALLRTGDRGLDSIISGAIRGGRGGGGIGDILRGAGGGLLRGITTGVPFLDSLIRSFGGILGSFGLRAALGCEGGTLGGVICNVVFSSTLIPGLLAGLSYIIGLYLGVMGIMKLREHVESPNQTRLSDSLKRFAAGGGFLALPIVLEAAYNTVAFGVDTYEGSDFEATGMSFGGLDSMIVALVADVWQPTIFLLSAFSYLAGIVLIMIGISRLLKSEQEGPRGPAGIGTFMTFLVGGALLSVDAMMGAFSFSLFDAGMGANVPILEYTAGMTGEEVARIESVISASIAFVAIIGWISFLRGIFMLRGISEGNSQASSIAALTHLFGGALAVNLGPLLNALQFTLGIDTIGITFF